MSTMTILTSIPHRYEFQIYIGDTDAYAMTYHTNYIKYYLRALYEALLSKQNISADDTIELLQITKQNFTKVAKLGDRVTIVTNTTCTECEQGDACLAESVSVEQEFFVNGVSMNTMSSIVCVFRKRHTTESNMADTATVTVTTSPTVTVTTSPTVTVTTSPTVTTMTTIPNSHTCFRIKAYSDLFDYNQRLSIPRVVDLFERSRNDAFGGPDKLSELKENGVHVIVVTIQKMKNHTLQGKFATLTISSGSELEVRNRVTVSMNGKRLTFGHHLIHATSGQLLIECEVVVYSVDQATHTLKELPGTVLRELERFR